jgi:hypothetical protein
MVEDETKPWQPPGDLDRCSKLASADQQVVGQSSLGHGGQPTQDVGPQQPVGIGLVVDKVSDPDEAVAVLSCS